MPKVLPSSKVDFELTESFWKTYKPDSVDGKELTKALKTFEERMEAAKTADKLDDEDETNAKVLHKKQEAWGAALSATTDVKTEIDKAIKELTKVKDSHINLRETMERTSAQMKRGAHVLQMVITKNRDKYVDLVGKASLEEHQDENKEFQEWLNDVETKEIRNWANAGREFQSLVELHKLSIASPSELSINNLFYTVSGWKRTGVFEKLSSSKNFHRNVDRQIKNMEAAAKDCFAAVVELKNAAKDCKDMANFLKKFVTDIGTEKTFWQNVKQECPVKD